MRGERTAQLLLACTLSLLVGTIVALYALITWDPATLTGALSGGGVALTLRLHLSRQA